VRFEGVQMIVMRRVSGRGGTTGLFGK